MSNVSTDAQPLTPVVLADGRWTTRRRREPSQRVLVWFALSTVLALVVGLAAGTVLASRVAEDEAFAEARELTDLLAGAVVEPNLTPSLLAGETGAANRFDEIMRKRLIGVTDVVRVKLWTAQGRIAYSDDHRLVGAVYPLHPEETQAIRKNETWAELSDLSAPENRFEKRSGRKLIEVYSPVRGPDGQRLLFETYFSYDVIDRRRSVLLRSFTSISLAGLLVFALFQLSLGYAVVRWLKRQRERLLTRAVQVSEDEKRRLASGLHDGIVQDLVGASYVVSGAAAELQRRGAGTDDVARDLTRATRGIRNSVRGLRSMIVDLYPASVRASGLETVLSDLLAPLPARDIATTLEVPDSHGLTERDETLIYRIAQEAVRNAVHHAHPERIDVRVTSGRAGSVLTVTDDGVGFAPGGESETGHIGLRTLADLAEDGGALLSVTTAPGRGTVVRLELPP